MLLFSAASAVATNSLLQSLAGAGFPLFAVQTFDNFGIQWAGTLLGCLAAVMIPVLFIFYKWGPKIRARSKFAPHTVAAKTVCGK
jgi:MFS transporter, DHA1 family, multidrug resistance protein